MTSTSYFTALDWAMAAALSTTKKMPHVGSGKRDRGEKNGGQREDRISIANKKRPLVTDEQGLPGQTPVNQKFRKVCSLMLSSICYYEQDVFGNWIIYFFEVNIVRLSFYTNFSSSTVNVAQKPNFRQNLCYQNGHGISKSVRRVICQCHQCLQMNISATGFFYRASLLNRSKSKI